MAESGEMLGSAEVEILSNPDHLVAPAAEALGWHGAVLPPMTLLGRRVAVVAELIAEAHAQRTEAGCGPVTDQLSVSMWDWPEMQQQAPPPAVRLQGVVAPARHWRTGLTAAVGFSGMCPTAVLLPSEAARDGGCLSYAEHYGPAVIATVGSSDLEVEVIREAPCGSAARPAAMSRWVHEVVYERVLALS